MKKMFSLESYPLRSEDLAWRIIDDEIIILTGDGRNIHTLNRVGSVIWELCDGTRNFKEIIDMISNRFDVPREEAHVDTLEFGAELVDKKILQIVNS